MTMPEISTPTIDNKVTLFVSGWLVFPALFVIQQWFWFNTKPGQRIISTYGFSPQDCSDISCKIVSSVQATLASIAGFIICINCTENVLYDSHPMTLTYAFFGIPYFVYDTIVMFYIYRMEDSKKKREENIVTEVVKFLLKSPVIVFHHMILAPLGFSLIAYGRDGIRNGDFFAGIVYLMETSTPFVSMRYILSKFKLKDSGWYIINGVSMLITFPIFRIISLFYAVGLYAKQNGLEYVDTLHNIPLGWKIVFCLAIAPQLYWYCLMCIGLYKMIAKSEWATRLTKQNRVKLVNNEKHSIGMNGVLYNKRPKHE